MEEPRERILTECSYCGNTTPHALQHTYTHTMLWDEFEPDEMIYQDHTWLLYACETCGGLSLYGGFFGPHGGPDAEMGLEKMRLYPRGSELLPPRHMFSPRAPVPAHILKLYEEIWPLRHKAPAAFVGQIRRLLEFVCNDKGATGKELFTQLEDLATKGVFPGHFAKMTDLLREIGNLGAHASDKKISLWDAELVDDFFRFVLEYVYIAPAKINRLLERTRENP